MLVYQRVYREGATRIQMLTRATEVCNIKTTSFWLVPKCSCTLSLTRLTKMFMAYHWGINGAENRLSLAYHHPNYSGYCNCPNYNL